MKKRILLFTGVAGIAAITLSSYDNGPAQGGGLNLTGAKNSATTCGQGCHGGNSANTTVAIELDSAGMPVTAYKAGMTYTVKITGSNTSSLPKFGFQFASVSGTGAAQVQAGSAASLPTNVHAQSLSGLSLVEHSAPLSGNNGAYGVSFQWVAPAAGTGTVTMYCTLNAVNGDGDDNAADLSNNTHTMYAEEASTSVGSLSADIQTTLYPNPATTQLNLKLNNAATGVYTVNVFDISGKVVMSEAVNVNSASFQKAINTSNWTAGIYAVQIVKDGAQRVLPIVKQ